MVFVFYTTHSKAQGLLLGLYSVVSPGGTQGTICSPNPLYLFSPTSDFEITLSLHPAWAVGTAQTWKSSNSIESPVLLLLCTVTQHFGALVSFHYLAAVTGRVTELVVRM